MSLHCSAQGAANLDRKAWPNIELYTLNQSGTVCVLVGSTGDIRFPIFAGSPKHHNHISLPINLISKGALPTLHSDC